MSLTDALSHSLFDNVRRPQAEGFVGKPIELEIEKMNLDKKTLREMFLKEIYHYKTDWREIYNNKWKIYYKKLNQML